MSTLKRIVLALVIIGAINWGLIGLFQFDLVATLFGGQNALLSRIVYTLVGISGLFSIAMLFSSIGDEEAGPRAERINYGTEFGEESHLDNKRDD